MRCIWCTVLDGFTSESLAQWSTLSSEMKFLFHSKCWKPLGTELTSPQKHPRKFYSLLSSEEYPRSRSTRSCLRLPSTSRLFRTLLCRLRKCSRRQDCARSTPQLPPTPQIRYRPWLLPTPRKAMESDHSIFAISWHLQSRCCVARAWTLEAVEYAGRRWGWRIWENAEGFSRLDFEVRWVCQYQSYHYHLYHGLIEAECVVPFMEMWWGSV